MSSETIIALMDESGTPSRTYAALFEIELGATCFVAASVGELLTVIRDRRPHLLIVGGKNNDVIGNSHIANLIKLAAPRTPMMLIGANDTLADASLDMPVDAPEFLW